MAPDGGRRIVEARTTPAELLSALGQAPASAETVQRAYNPDQPRVPAGNGTESGQWTGGEPVLGPCTDGATPPDAASDFAASGANRPIRIADASDDWARYLNPVTTADAAMANGGGASKPGAPVVLPNRQKIPTGDDPSKPQYLMSPTADLAPVAAAGRGVGSTCRTLQDSPDPQTGGGAFSYLGTNLQIYLGHGGNFDYQRQGHFLTGFVFFIEFVSVSNFNVGLFCQQAGLTLDETLQIAGTLAAIMSRNGNPGNPYSLADLQYKYMVLGYQTGASGAFDSPVPPRNAFRIITISKNMKSAAKFFACIILVLRAARSCFISYVCSTETLETITDPFPVWTFRSLIPVGILSEVATWPASSYPKPAPAGAI